MKNRRHCSRNHAAPFAPLTATLTLSATLALALPLPSMAFLEEGGNVPASVAAFGTCTYNAKNPKKASPAYGDLSMAASLGCNPWNDSDSAYSYKKSGDMPKSSMHFNMTQALALAAGFTPCAAFAVALADEGADVGNAYDQTFWAPLPAGLDPASCGALFKAEGITPERGLHGKPGAWISPNFTQRGTGSSAGEQTRESHTFHWNPTFENANLETSRFSTNCSKAGDQNVNVKPPFADLVTLKDLWRWAAMADGSGALNPCDFTTGKGPIANYAQTNKIKPNSLAALGTLMHALQDAISHRNIITNDISKEAIAFNHTNIETDPVNDQAPIDVSLLSGWPSSHLAGEFGVNPKTGLLGTGSEIINLITETGKQGYLVRLHSQDSADAAETSFQVLSRFLALPGHEHYQASNKPGCDSQVLKRLYTDFAGTPNQSQQKKRPSGAKMRSDMADQLAANLIHHKGCSYQ